MAQSYRFFWGPQTDRAFGFNWDIIHHDSVVVITAGEGPGFDVTPAPQRITGAATFLVGSIAAHENGVTFSVLMGYYDVVTSDGGVAFRPWGSPLNLWTDITVFDPSEFKGQGGF